MRQEPVDRETFNAAEEAAGAEVVPRPDHDYSDEDDDRTFDDFIHVMKNAYIAHDTCLAQLSLAEARLRDARVAVEISLENLQDSKKNLRAAWEDLSESLGMPVPDKVGQANSSTRASWENP